MKIGLLVILIMVILIAIVLSISFSLYFYKNNKMIIKSVFENKKEIPVKYTCDGDDISPELVITNIPENAKSLALIVHDPDAPAGDWVHWIVWNIPVKEEVDIKEGEKPGIQGLNDFKKIDYGGPCPPSGIHRYFFEVYALDYILDLKQGSNISELKKAIKGHVIEKSELIGLYER